MKDMMCDGRVDQQTYAPVPGQKRLGDAHIIFKRFRAG